MNEIKFNIPIPPRTKKNSQRLIKTKAGRIIPIPSKQYESYEKQCGWFVKPLAIDYPVNVKCLYYMDARRRVDLPNLIEATLDMLMRYNVIEDDNRNVVYSTDGSRVLYDKANPRTEIVITPVPESEFEVWDTKQTRTKR